MAMDAHDLANLIREKFREGDAKLPVLPETIIEVRKIVADEERGAADIAKALALDSTLSTTVLRIANSARFRTGGAEIRNLPMAVQRLGGRKTLQLLTAISAQVHLAVKNKELQGVLREGSKHAQMVAVAAQHLARLIGSVDPEEAFLGGMLFDVGVAAMICAVPDDILKCPAADRIELIKQLHREMGGRLLTDWQMPDPFIALASHHGVEADDRPRLNLIDLIDSVQFMLHNAGHELPFDDVPDGIEALHYPPMKRLGITETHLAAVEVELEDGLLEVGELLN